MSARRLHLAWTALAEHHAQEGTPVWLVPHRTLDGNRPSDTILAERLTPETLGKVLAQRLIPELDAGVPSPALHHDSATNALIARYRSLRQCQDGGGRS